MAAVLAFSAFFTLWAAVRFSLPSLMAAWRAAERASGRCARRSLMTSREAPTMARWDLTARRRLDLAASCGGCEHLMSFECPVQSSSRGCVPQRYPFSSCDGTEQSMRSCGGSCAGGRETRTFRTGSGRSCCPSGRRACPVEIVCQHECRSSIVPSNPIWGLNMRLQDSPRSRHGQRFPSLSDQSHSMQSSRSHARLTIRPSLPEAWPVSFRVLLAGAFV